MKQQRGAALLVILMIAGVLGAFFAMQLFGGASAERNRVSATTLTLTQARDALIGFAIVNGRLPCSALATSNGQESFAAGGNAVNGLCSDFYRGYLPGATLGLSSVDDNGFAIDSWGIKSNRIRYAVFTGTINFVLNPFTKIDGMKNAVKANILATTPMLSVCASATGINVTNCGTAIALTNQAPVVIYSLGRNAATGGTGTDEAANPNPNSANNDPVFVSHPATTAGAANGEFDDIVTWLDPNILVVRMGLP